MKLINADSLKKYFFRPYSNEECYTNDDIAEIIDALPVYEQQRWIPCSERFPEDDTPVLVYLFESNSPYIAWVSDCEWFTEEFQIEKEYEPKAWMPLPEPLESEEL